ncbi:MAG: hypothetical protein J1E38_02630 [Paramuribaculum sp.]|nr:hypothetical protein [Paramuribaculum sp.]
MSNIHVSAPIKGMPEKFENELQRAVYENLEALGIDYLRTENDPAVTMEDCTAIDNAFGVKTIKTIFLTNRQKTKFYLLSMPADKPFVTRHFCGAMMIPRVSFADDGMLEEKLGTPQGAATPLSVVIDKDCQVEVSIDMDLLENDRIVCPDGTLHGYVCLKLTELIDKYLDSTGHKPRLLNMPRE